MFENIRKIILYLMSDAFAEIIVVIGSMSMGMPLPITAVQILWINLVSDGFPDLALTIDTKRVDIMNERPRPPKERLVNNWMIHLISVVSLVAGTIALSSFVVAYRLTGDLIMARSLTFAVLGLNSLVYVFSVRTLMTPAWKNRPFENKWLMMAVIIGFGLQILPFTTPTLRQFFGLDSLGLVYWLMAIGMSIFMFFVVEVFKASYRFSLIKK